MNDRYAAALERALFNWYHSGDGAPTEPVFNALKEGQTNDMQLLVPIDIPEALLRQLSSQENLQEGARFSIDEDMPISFKHIPVDEEGRYLIPLFTREEQMELGESSSAISQPFGALLAAMDKWPDCVGFVINPYSDKIWVNEAIRGKIAGFEPKSHVAFVKGSVLDMKVSAIVNSAHRTLLGDSMVDEIIMDDADGAPVAEAYLCSAGMDAADTCLVHQQPQRLHIILRFRPYDCPHILYQHCRPPLKGRNSLIGVSDNRYPLSYHLSHIVDLGIYIISFSRAYVDSRRPENIRLRKACSQLIGKLSRYTHDAVIAGTLHPFHTTSAYLFQEQHTFHGLFPGPATDESSMMYHQYRLHAAPEHIIDGISQLFAA